ncbi:MAG: cytochrome c oxidase assembly protein [Gammaproteobacteria bacterium]|jgi:putative membrane protein
MNAELNHIISFLTPWEFSLTVLLTCSVTVAVYVGGLWRMRRAGEAVNPWRAAAFLLGLVGIYLFLQSYLDYLSQHMFWVHRLQHLVLHHAGPFLIALSAPGAILARGAPAWMKAGLRAIWAIPGVRLLYRIVQHPLVASLLFVGLIAFWLLPEVHFQAMLSEPRYKAMNWSMVIDGLLFWWLILAPGGEPYTPGYGTRLLMLWGVMLPQIAIGAYIGLSNHVLYDVYSVCGRAWPIAPMTDQELGGLITWIPASMMSVLGALVLLRRILLSRPSHRRTAALEINE